MKKTLFVLVIIFVLACLVFVDSVLANNLLLYTSLDSLSAAQTPTTGPSGTTNLGAGDFIPGYSGNGASFSSDTDYLYYPTDSIFQSDDGDIPEERVIDFWYKPNYDQDDDTRDHFLLSDSSERFYIKYLNSDNSVRLFIKLSSTFDMSLATKHSIGWEAGDWVHIQAYWYDQFVANPDPATIIIPQILVNGEGAEFTHNGDYKNLNAPTNLFVGNKNDSSSLSANGIIDEVKIYDQRWSPTIISISPSNPDQGDIITISGSDFGPSDNSTVTVGGTSATISSWSQTEIKVIVPGVSSGTKDVVVSTWGEMDSNSDSITIGQAPSVSNLKASSIKKHSAIISWQTSKPSRTIINWGKTTAYGNQYTDSTLKTTHDKKLINLSPGTKYNFMVSVRDAYNNTGSTQNYSFKTDNEGLIINPPNNDDEIEFIPSSGQTEDSQDEKSVDSKEESSDSSDVRIIVIDPDNNSHQLKKDSYLRGDRFKFRGETDPNTEICLIFNNGEERRVCTYSDQSGSWEIELSDINPGNYELWTELSDRNIKSEKFQVQVASADDNKQDGSKFWQWPYLLAVVLILLVLISCLVWKRYRY